MRELNQEQVRALADAADLKVPEEEMGRLTVRLNGMFELLYKLDSLPLDDAEIIPTLLTQRED